MAIKLTINNEPRELDVDPQMPLLWAIRDHVRQIAQLPSLLRYTGSGVRRVRHTRQNGSDDVARLKAPKCFMNHRLTTRRRFATASVPFVKPLVTQTRPSPGVGGVMLAKLPE